MDVSSLRAFRDVNRHLFVSRTRVGGEILCGRGWRVYERRITASGQSRRYSNEVHFDRFDRIARNATIPFISAAGTKLTNRADAVRAAPA
jgi:hypothetical protein